MNKLASALEEVMKTIKKEFGEMAILRLGDAADKSVEVIPTGSLALDLALGVSGGFRADASSNAMDTSRPARRRLRCMSSPTRRRRAERRRSSTRSMR